MRTEDRKARAVAEDESRRPRPETGQVLTVRHSNWRRTATRRGRGWSRPARAGRGEHLGCGPAAAHRPRPGRPSGCVGGAEADSPAGGSGNHGGRLPDHSEGSAADRGQSVRRHRLGRHRLGRHLLGLPDACPRATAAFRADGLRGRLYCAPSYPLFFTISSATAARPCRRVQQVPA